MADTNVTVHNIFINGHKVPLFTPEDVGFPTNAAGTDWLLVKFDQPIYYALNRAFRQDEQLEIHERLDDENVYLCKYLPHDLNPVISNVRVTHLTLYPTRAVPIQALIPNVTNGNNANSDGLDGVTHGPSQRTDETVQNVEGVDGTTTIDPGTDGRMDLVIALHPNPIQTPEQILQELEMVFGAEHLDPRVVPAANLVRVNLDRRHIPDVAAIDSVRTITEVHHVVPLSIVTDGIVGTNSLTTSFPWDGLNEVIHVADTGFDGGSAYNVHPAFTGRVLAVTTYNSNYAFDDVGHGTHVAGSALGDLSQSVGTDMTNMKGTAPKAKLVSQALAFGPGKPPPLIDLFTSAVIPSSRPTIHTNSWGPGIIGTQFPYGPDNASLVDKAMSDDPELCILFSAGNSGEYLTQNQRQQQVGAWASAKNSIVVGASENARPLDGNGAYNSNGTVPSPREMATFSSRGPTIENRLGIDVVAPGQVVLSARSRAIAPANLTKYLLNFGKPTMNNLLFLNGTSMSTPAVAGCVACLRQAYRDIYQDSPSGALLKALIIHGAIDLEGTEFRNKTPAGTTILTMTAAPNTFQGFGLVNMDSSLIPLIFPSTGTRGTKMGTVAAGSSIVQILTIPTGLIQLVVTLAYSDAPSHWLQTNIKMQLRRPGMPPIFPLEPTDPLNSTPKMHFADNNVSKIVVRNPESGVYSVNFDVITKLNDAPYALVWSAV